MSAEEMRLILTEDGYTTADGPMSKGEALAEFDRFARHVSPRSGGRLRVMSDAEYQHTLAAGWDEEECPDCLCCTRDQCNRKTCSGRCPCSSG